MPLIYIGAFPPGYGGVTIKNENLYKAISDRVRIKKIDLNLVKRKKVKETVRLAAALLSRKNKLVIGVSGRKTRKIFCGVLYYLNKPVMRRSLLIVMGGTASSDMAADRAYGRYVREYKTIYVETSRMRQTLLDAGIHNVEIYPNGRFRPAGHVQPNISGRLKCVFFSKICEQKGCTEILEAAQNLSNVDFDFYGEIDSGYSGFFNSRIDKLKNAVYHGVFSGSPADVYGELSKYDVLLFPTRYTIEGVPGILVEAKISGLAVIASDVSYNKEIVKDGGFLLSQNTAGCLTEKIREYEKDRNLLNVHKENSLHSADEFFIDNYIPKLVADAVGGG